MLFPIMTEKGGKVFLASLPISISTSSDHQWFLDAFWNIPKFESEEDSMGQLLTTHEPVCRLTFEGKMTFEVSRELEDRILSAMRSYRHLEVDLSGVREIDLCGIHLLGLLQSVGGKEVRIVATSPVVEQASTRLLGSFRGASLARAARLENAVRNC